MSTTQYIRPMNFREIVISMFRLYWKVFIPITIINVIVTAFSLIIPIGGALSMVAGPGLVITSNAILGKPLKIGTSINKGLFSNSFLKIIVFSLGFNVIGGIIGFAVLTFLYAVLNPIFSLDSDIGLSIFIWLIIFIYLLIIPTWVFTPMIMLLEKKGLGASISRAIHIVGKNFKRVLQMNIFIIIVMAIPSILLSALMGGVNSETFGIAAVVVFFLFVLASVFGIQTYPYVFVYYEYRARHENYTEELLAQELGYAVSTELLTV